MSFLQNFDFKSKHAPHGKKTNKQTNKLSRAFLYEENNIARKTYEVFSCRKAERPACISCAYFKSAIFLEFQSVESFEI